MSIKLQLAKLRMSYKQFFKFLKCVCFRIFAFCVLNRESPLLVDSDDDQCDVTQRRKKNEPVSCLSASVAVITPVKSPTKFKPPDRPTSMTLVVTASHVSKDCNIYIQEINEGLLLLCLKLKVIFFVLVDIYIALSCDCLYKLSHCFHYYKF